MDSNTTRKVQVRPAASGAQNMQMAYQGGNANTGMAYRVAMIPDRFSLGKYILLSIVTLGLYSVYCMAKMGSLLDRIAGRYDGKRTMNYWLLWLLVGPLTFGIGYIVWPHRFCNRMGEELYRRGINYPISSGTFWLWNVLGVFIIIGPFVYMYKLFVAMNLLIEHYNENE